MEENLFENRIDLSELNKQVETIREEIRKVIVGQDEMIKLLITAILADGHVLIEGVPGVAKTLTAKLLSRVKRKAMLKLNLVIDQAQYSMLRAPR